MNGCSLTHSVFRRVAARHALSNRVNFAIASRGKTSPLRENMTQWLYNCCMNLSMGSIKWTWRESFQSRDAHSFNAISALSHHHMLLSCPAIIHERTDTSGQSQLFSQAWSKQSAYAGHHKASSSCSLWAYTVVITNSCLAFFHRRQFTPHWREGLFLCLC